jgi:hypothetical protein
MRQPGKTRQCSPAGPHNRLLANLHRDAEWCGRKLYHHGQVMAEIIPDQTYPSMWRIKLPDGSISDMVNLARARDAAASLVVQAYSAAPKQGDQNA